MAETSGGLQGAADRIRETAKWFAVSLAAIAGVLVAGSQLSDIGSLELESGRLGLAIIGAAAAACGAVAIIVVTGRTATAPAVSLESLASRVPKGVKANTDKSLLGGYDNVTALQHEYAAAITARSAAQEAHLADPLDKSLKLKAEAADARALAAHDTAGELLKVASYQQLVHRWHWAQFWICLGGIVATAGVGLFAWAANPPADAVASAAAPNVLTSPMMKELRLTAAGTEALLSSLGASCITDRPIGVLVLATTQAGPDLLVVQSGCSRIRLVLGSPWGTVSG